MTFPRFIREKLLYILVNLVFYFLTSAFLIFIHVKSGWIVFMFFIWFGPLVIAWGIEFVKKRNFYQALEQYLETMDQKYLLHEVIERPDFIEGEVIHDILRVTNKEMIEHVNFYKHEQLEYREYIEAWVHEIKTPIASAKLILDNKKNSESIYPQLDRMEEYIEQVLYYARSSQVSKDYIVSEFPLRKVLVKVMKKNSRDFIQKKVKLEMGEVDTKVFTDAKWLEFILNQIIVNALKYTLGEEKVIKIYTTEKENSVVLTIEDNGIGIAPKDVARVFDKGFTGENGRVYGKSTGMGLYICKKLATKLHLGISIESEKGVGTKVHLHFPINKALLMDS